MKTLINYINEQQGSSFSQTVKYSNEDYAKWKDTVMKHAKDIEIDTQDGEDGEFDCIYLVSGRQHKHIATYIYDKEELYCDDTKLFGHEVK